MDEKTLDSQAMERLREELLDTLDEELELELEDETLVFPAGGEHPNIVESASALPRRVYFTELIRLQRELVKLQDWVVETKQRVVILFEGRDAAGKGGVIKRITRDMNLDEDRWPPKQTQWWINSHKDEGRRAFEIEDHGEPVPFVFECGEVHAHERCVSEVEGLRG